jgi:hypothetical protein
LVCTGGQEDAPPRSTRTFDPEEFEVHLGDHVLYKL